TLVADVLRDGLLDGSRGRLVLDDDEGNAVDKEDDVDPPSVVRPNPLDRELHSHVIRVVLRALPIDVAEGVTLPVAINSFFNRGSQEKQVVDVLIGSDQSPLLRRRRLESADRLLSVALVEAVFLAPVGEPVATKDLLCKDILEDNLSKPTALGFESPLGKKAIAETHER